MTTKQDAPDLSNRPPRRRPQPAPQTPDPGAVLPTRAAPADPAPQARPTGAPVRALRTVPTVALNTRQPIDVFEAVVAAAQRPETPSQRAVIEDLVRRHLMGQNPDN